MSNDKSKIEIGIKATGGDAAAEEISKPIDAQTEAAEKLREKQESDKAFYAKMAEDDEKARQAMVAQLKKEEEARLAVVEARKKETAAAKETQAATSGPGTPMFEYQERSVKTVTDAAAEAKAPIEDVTEALDEMIGGDGAGLQGVAEESAKAGAATTSLGGRLIALAGGPIGIAVAAFSALLTVFVKIRSTLIEVDETASDVISSAGEAIDALNADDATTSVGSLADELQRLTDRQNEANAAFFTAAERLNTLKDAQATLAKSQIDYDVATGKITADEGRIKKAQMEIEIDQRRVDLQVELASSQKETAEAASRNADEAVKIAEAELNAAKEKEKLRSADAARALVDAQTKALRASAMGDIGILDPNGGNKAIELAGGADEVRRLIDNMKGLAGVNARAGLSGGLPLDQILGPMERAAIAKQMADESKVEADAAAEAAERIKGLSDAAVTEKEAQVESLRKTRVAAEAEAEQAEKALEAAKFQKVLSEQFLIPAAENDIAALNASRSKQDADNARKAREKAALDARRAEIDAEAQGARPDLDRRAQRMGAAGLDKALVSKAESIAQGLSDGVNLSEAEQGLAAFDALITRIPEASRAQAMQAVAPFIARLSSFERMLQDLERTVKEGR